MSGHESIAVNDILQSSTWRTEKKWHWKRKSHINILEAHAGLGVLTAAAADLPDSRCLGLLDSRVAKGALAKGRSSSTGLQKTCKKSAAIQLAFGLYPGWCFAPTRLNVADDPTRRCALRSPSLLCITKKLSAAQLQAVHSHLLSRWAANWSRLVILLIICQSPSEATSTLLPDQKPNWISDLASAGSLLRVFLVALLDFEPPSIDLPALPSFNISSPQPYLLWTLCIGLVTIFLASCGSVGLRGSFGRGCPSVKGAPGRLLWILICGFWVADAMAPQTALERGRAERRSGNNLIATRVARHDTLERREKLLTDFRVWLHDQHKVHLSLLLTAKPPDAEEICKWLISYGQEMYLSGKAYGKFAETINAVSAARPVVRKQLAGAWDPAFAWLTDEPSEHHPALPLSILLAMLALALMWGWPLEAAVLSLTWCGICRIGEVLIAQRCDLILPCDSAPGVTFGLLRIKTPKTRGRAARHQAARIDPPDILKLLTAVYAKAPPTSLLWPFSASTLRKRFSNLLSGLGLQTTKINGRRPFDLGSLRPGGATHLLLTTEDSELVRRRGRWVTGKVMEIYLQEILYTTFAEKLDWKTRVKVTQLAGNFPRLLDCASDFLNSAIPPQTWWRLFQASDNEEHGEERG